MNTYELSEAVRLLAALAAATADDENEQRVCALAVLIDAVEEAAASGSLPGAVGGEELVRGCAAAIATLAEAMARDTKSEEMREQYGALGIAARELARGKEQALAALAAGRYVEALKLAPELGALV